MASLRLGRSYQPDRRRPNKAELGEKLDRMTRDTPFSALPADFVTELFGAARTVALPRHQVLFRAGDPGDGCYRVIDGLLKVTAAAPSRRERILAILGPGALVGELSLIDGAVRSASVTAIREAQLRFVTRAEFEAFAKARPEVFRHISAGLARRLRDNNDALVATSFLSVKGRAARALLSLADAFGEDVGAGRILIHQKVSQGDLAAMAGIARENLSRILQAWMRDKLIKRLASYYCVENKAALQREAEN
jgi:CRP/FNR family transcriptional regulator, cyclic AMP receptor protein